MVGSTIKPSLISVRMLSPIGCVCSFRDGTTRFSSLREVSLVILPAQPAESKKTVTMVVTAIKRSLRLLLSLNRRSFSSGGRQDTGRFFRLLLSSGLSAHCTLVRGLVYASATLPLSSARGLFPPGCRRDSGCLFLPRSFFKYSSYLICNNLYSPVYYIIVLRVVNPYTFIPMSPGLF